jgi:hypothetical protein
LSGLLELVEMEVGGVDLLTLLLVCLSWQLLLGLLELVEMEVGGFRGRLFSSFWG